MPAFTVDFDLIQISLSYDTLTLYYEFENFFYELPDKKIILKIKSFKSCKGISEHISEDCINDLRDAINKVSKDIQSEMDLQKFIRDIDNDHSLYHQDGFDIHHEHLHFKFKSFITEEKLKNILQIFLNHHLISEDEKESAQLFYYHHFKDIHDNLKNSFVKEAQSDACKIIQFIEVCSDYDVLIFMHHFLLKSDFDYLRDVDDQAIVKYKGQNAQGEISETSEHWAMIEKSLTLKVETNILEQSNLDKKSFPNLANYLKGEHAFFAIKRKNRTNGDVISKNYIAFSNSETKHLQEIYQNHFAKFR